MWQVNAFIDFENMPNVFNFIGITFLSRSRCRQHLGFSEYIWSITVKLDVLYIFLSRSCIFVGGGGLHQCTHIIFIFITNFYYFLPWHWWASLRAYWNDDIKNHHFMWIKFHLYGSFLKTNAHTTRSNEIFNKIKKICIYMCVSLIWYFRNQVEFTAGIFDSISCCTFRNDFYIVLPSKLSRCLNIDQQPNCSCCNG